MGSSSSKPTITPNPIYPDFPLEKIQTFFDSKAKKAVLLFPGSFNPVHIGHIQMAMTSKQQLEASGFAVAVVFAPSNPAWLNGKKHSVKTLLAIRCELIAMTLAETGLTEAEGWFVSGFDQSAMVHGIPRDFPDTIDATKQLLPTNIQLWYLFGADHAKHVLKVSKPLNCDGCVVVARSGTDSTGWPPLWMKVETPLRTDISSTQIREILLSKNKDKAGALSGKLTPAEISYLLEQKY